MDPLTVRLLERTRARREDLAKKMAEQNGGSTQKRKAPLAPNSSLNTLPMEHENSLRTDGSQQKPSPKTAMKSRFNTLATQRAQWDIEQEGRELDSSPVLPKLQTRQASNAGEAKPAPSNRSTAPARKNRFAALAANINSWEDDMHHPDLTPRKDVTPAKRWPAPQHPPGESGPTPTKRETQPNSVIKPRSPIKQSVQGLESAQSSATPSQGQQGSRPAMSRSARFQLGASRLGDDSFQSSTTRNVVLPQAKECTAVDRNPQTVKPSVRQNTHAAPPPSQDNPGPRPSPRTPATQEKAPSPLKRPAQGQGPVSASKKKAPSPSRETPGVDVLSPNKVDPKVGAMAKSIQDRLKAHKDNWQSNEISKKIQEDRLKDMAILKGRWTKTGGEVGDTSQQQQEQDEMDHETSQDEEEARESLAYMETDIDVDGPSDHDDSVFTAHNESSTVSSVHDESGTAERSESDDSDDEEEESDVNLTDVLGDIDELIVEAEKAMKDEKQKGSQKPGEPVIQQQVETVTQSKPHLSSEVRAVPNERPPRPEPSPAPQPQKPVAAERRGPPPQQQTRPPPQPSRPAPPQQTQPPPQQSRPRTRSAQRVVRDEQIREQQHQQRTDASRKTKSVNAERIQRLTSEVSTHQSVINQTSQALSLIAANESLRNTLEEIEAEKMMVISNQKRQACLSEIQFLKNGPPVEESYAGDGSPAPKGHITINNIRLPFKTEYIMDLQSNKEMPSHYYFLVTRCGAQVTATNLLNTRENLTGDCLQFSTEVEISSLESDFSIEMLVYQLRSTVTRIEGMAERAVHPVAQTKTSRFGSLTPKKLRKTASKKNKRTVKRRKQQRSSVSSMGGSQPVRSCTFAVAGSARLTLASCGTTKFMLSRVPLTSPLEGSIHLCLGCRKNSSIALNGFLTMFDEISGFGSWHRRWCTLAEGYITFWKYPDDEKKKPPIGSIDLRECITKEVAQISRILCARPNTFELVTTRPASRYDKETLVSSCNNSVLTTKYMISADVKEERMEWIDALNRTLVDLRLWNKDAALPTE